MTLIISRLFSMIIALPIAVPMLLGTSTVSFGQTGPTESPAGESIVVAVIPICLAEVTEPRNAITINVAKEITSSLKKEKSLRLLSQQEIINSFKMANISYMDVTGKNFPELDKAAPPHKVVVFVGPHPGKEGWFRVIVARSPDLMGKEQRIYLKDQETVSFAGKVTVDDIHEAIAAP